MARTSDQDGNGVVELRLFRRGRPLVRCRARTPVGTSISPAATTQPASPLLICSKPARSARRPCSSPKFSLDNKQLCSEILFARHLQSPIAPPPPAPPLAGRNPATKPLDPATPIARLTAEANAVAAADRQPALWHGQRAMTAPGVPLRQTNWAPSPPKQRSHGKTLPVRPAEAGSSLHAQAHHNSNAARGAIADQHSEKGPATR
jgi:hypothetical protein